MQIKEERHPWRVEEDNLIVDLVRLHGTKKWTLIAEVLGEKVHNSRRNGKQCRERWHNHLDPMVRKSPWNESEEFVFIEAHKLHGNKWAEIAKMIPGRTDNSIKNHFYSTLRKLISRVQKEEIPPEMKYDPQIRKHTTYLSKYLKNLIVANQKTLGGALQEATPTSGQRTFVGRGSSHLNQFLLDNNIEMGSNDLYVIKKLREADITLDKIDAYLRKVYFSIKEANGYGVRAVEAADEKGTKGMIESHFEQIEEDINAQPVKMAFQTKQNDHSVDTKMASKDINEGLQERIPLENRYQLQTSNNQLSRPIFQISKEEIKSEALSPYMLTSNGDLDKKESSIGDMLLVDDYEKFINEGDHLVLDDLEVKRAALLSEYLISKEAEQSKQGIGNGQASSKCENIHHGGMPQNMLRLSSENHETHSVSEYIFINDKNESIPLNIARHNQMQNASFQQSLQKSLAPHQVESPCLASGAMNQNQKCLPNKQGKTGVNHLIIDSTPSSVHQDNVPSPFAQYIQVPTYSPYQQPYQQTQQILCIPVGHDSLSNNQHQFYVTSNALGGAGFCNGSTFLYHQDTGMSPNIPQGGQTRIIVAAQSPHQAISLNQNNISQQQAYYQDLGQFLGSQKNQGMNAACSQQSPYMAIYQTHNEGGPGNKNSEKHDQKQNQLSNQISKESNTPEGRVAAYFSNSAQMASKHHLSSNYDIKTQRSHQVFFAPQVMKGTWSQIPSSASADVTNQAHYGIQQIHSQYQQRPQTINRQMPVNGHQDKSMQDSEVLIGLPSVPTIQNSYSIGSPYQRGISSVISDQRFQENDQKLQRLLHSLQALNQGAPAAQPNQQGVRTGQQVQSPSTPLQYLIVNPEKAPHNSYQRKIIPVQSKHHNTNQATSNNGFQRGFSAPLQNSSAQQQHSPLDTAQVVYYQGQSGSLGVASHMPASAAYSQNPNLRQDQPQPQRRQVQTKILVSQTSSLTQQVSGAKVDLDQFAHVIPSIQGGNASMEVSKDVETVKGEVNKQMMSNLSQESTTQVVQMPQVWAAASLSKSNNNQ